MSIVAPRAVASRRRIRLRAGVVRACLLLGLLLGLDGCSVYNRIFRPHYIPDPPMSPAVKARMKAAEKARKAGLKSDKDPATAAVEGTTDVSTPTEEAPATPEAADPPPKSNAKFSKKTGRIKKPKLKYRRYKSRKPRKQKSRDQNGENFFTK